MRLEQRIGRIDRIGQTKVARVFNLLLADSVEYRVQEVLEEKLATILAEFGVDKTADLLDSQEAGAEFERVYREALLNPAEITARVDALLSTVREQGAAAQRSAQLLAEERPLDPAAAARMRGHPLAQWLGRMVEAGVVADGGSVRRTDSAISAQWPDGREQTLVLDGEIGVLLAHEAVTDLLARCYRHAPAQAVPWL